MTDFRSGFIGIVGRPNVGKSTLVNALVGEKIVISAAKPQTTRQRIRVILTTKQAQVIFYDTPGLHKPQHKLGEEMNKAALNTFKLVDAVLWLTDATQPVGRGDRWVAEKLRDFSGPVLVAINKIDLASGVDLGKYIEKIGARQWPVVRVSALTGQGLPELLERMIGLLPAGPQYYPAEMLTDQPEAVIISDLIREGIIEQTEEEVPHSVAVVVEELKERGKGPREKRITYVRATILVERDSQKKILIGKGGQRLKLIGTAGRNAVEEYLGAPVFLDLWVKTRKDWRDSLPDLKKLGYIEEME
ncbi:MAG TPA: GTPase Era [Firmicutes bacterium]|nr:GTPase Era [Bacillota bacterium]